MHSQCGANHRSLIRQQASYTRLARPYHCNSSIYLGPSCLVTEPDLSATLLASLSSENKPAKDDFIGGRSVLCKFCQHWYIHPCTDATYANCPNIIAKQRRKNAPALQQSIRHHYIPVFYLKRWGGSDRRICQFSQPYKRIHKKRVYPAQTGSSTDYTKQKEYHRRRLRRWKKNS